MRIDLHRRQDASPGLGLEVGRFYCDVPGETNADINPQLRFYRRNRDKIKAKRSGPVFAEKRKKTREAWAEENKERELGRHRKWVAENKEHHAAYMREYHRRNKDKINARNKLARAENPEKYREKHYQYNYGMSLADRDALFADQGFCCAVCGTDKPGCKVGWGWHIDHCHRSGEVRGIVCHHCNTALGNAKDSPDILRKLAFYLEQHAETVQE